MIEKLIKDSNSIVLFFNKKYYLCNKKNEFNYANC